jgi:hypothetical protein
MARVKPLPMFKLSSSPKLEPSTEEQIVESLDLWKAGISKLNQAQIKDLASRGVNPLDLIEPDSVSAPVVQGKKPGRAPKCLCGVCLTCKNRKWRAQWESRKRQSK